MGGKEGREPVARMILSADISFSSTCSVYASLSVPNPDNRDAAALFPALQHPAKDADAPVFIRCQGRIIKGDAGNVNAIPVGVSNRFPHLRAMQQRLGGMQPRFSKYPNSPDSINAVCKPYCSEWPLRTSGAAAQNSYIKLSTMTMPFLQQ